MVNQKARIDETYSSRGLEAAETRWETAYPTVGTPSERETVRLHFCLQSNDDDAMCGRKSQETTAAEPSKQNKI